MTLLSIENEAAACRKAFEGVEVGRLAVHVHHKVGVELLIEPAENRIRHILYQKPRSERALRLRLFRPVPERVAAKYPDMLDAKAAWIKVCHDWGEPYSVWKRACADWIRALASPSFSIHAEVCSCGWDGADILNLLANGNF